MRVRLFRMPDLSGTRLAAAAALSCCLLAAGVAVAGWDEVEALYREARYAEAAAEADSLGGGDQTLRSLYWRARLGTDPAEVLSDLRRAAAHPACTEELAACLAAEEGWILFGRGEPDSALHALAAVESDLRSGDHWLLAGMAERALGRLEDSRDAFASVTPDDPEYAWARTFLGRLAQQEGDRALAERYYRAAAEAEHPVTGPALLEAAWEMDRVIDPQAAQKKADELFERHPRSLEAARLRDLAAREAQADSGAVDQPAAAEEQSVAIAGRDRRLALQLAAFSDRGRALAYLDQWRDILQGLRIVDSRDAHGEVLYKVRYGSFVTRAQASARADELEREHGLKVLLVEAAESR